VIIKFDGLDLMVIITLSDNSSSLKNLQPLSGVYFKSLEP